MTRQPHGISELLARDRPCYFSFLFKNYSFIYIPNAASLPGEKTFQIFSLLSQLAEQSNHSQVMLFIKTPVLHSSHQLHLKTGSPLATDINGIPPGDNVLPPSSGSNQHTDYQVALWEFGRDAFGSLSAFHKAFLHLGRHNCLTCHPGWGPRRTGVASSVGGC